MRTTTPTFACVGVVIAIVAVEPGLDAQRNTPDEETVVYSSLAPGNWDVYRFDRRGEPPTRLTTDPGLDYNPVVSPDGRWVVFTSERAGSPDLYALDLEQAGDPVRLTVSDAMEDAADFSPDGRTLVFVSTRTGNPDVYSMRFDPEDPDARRDPEIARPSLLRSQPELTRAVDSSRRVDAEDSRPGLPLRPPTPCGRQSRANAPSSQPRRVSCLVGLPCLCQRIDPPPGPLPRISPIKRGRGTDLW